MSFTSSDYNITFTHQDINYDIQLVKGQKSDTTVLINGVTYSVLTDKEQTNTVKQILSSISLESISSIKDLSNRMNWGPKRCFCC